MQSEAAKRCSKCGEVKRLSAFPPDKHRPLGVGALCKLCRREVCRGYRERHPGRVKASSDQYCAANRERLNEKSRSYRTAQRDQISVRRKARWLLSRERERPRLRRYRLEHKDQLYAKAKEWELRNPEKVAAKSLRYALRQAGFPVVQNWVEAKVAQILVLREVRRRKRAALQPDA